MTAPTKELIEIQRRLEHSSKLCEKQLLELRNFNSDLSVIFGCVIDNSDAEKARQSLGFLRFLQSVLYLAELPLLLMAAHYTSGIQILRYHLESSIQAFYLDQQHPTFSLENKICVLTEIADSREYFVARLIERISVSQKESLKKLYKELSLASHPSHLDFPTVDQMMERLKKMEASINCEEMNKVLNLTKRTYDAIFFLTFERIAKAKEAAQKRPDVGEVIKKHNLPLLEKMVSSH